jgi:hypothetical protein
MSDVRCSIVVPDETDRALRSYLGRRGTKKGDISRFVEEAVKARLLEPTVEDVKKSSRSTPQEDILAAIDEALAADERQLQ